MSKSQLTGKQTILLGQAIAALDLAKAAAKMAEEKLANLESSMIGTDTALGEAVTSAVGDIDEALSAIDNASVVNDFAWEDGSERRVAKMLRGMEHRP